MPFTLPSGIALPMGLPSRHAAELAGAAELLGFREVWVPAVHGRDPLVTATAIALATKRIRVGVGPLDLRHRVVEVFASIATLHELSGDRATVAIGRPDALVRFPDDHPRDDSSHGNGDSADDEDDLDEQVAFEELLRAFEALRTGELVDYDGEFVQLVGAQVAFADPSIEVALAVGEFSGAGLAHLADRLLIPVSLVSAVPAGATVVASIVTSAAERHALNDSMSTIVGTPKECASTLRSLVADGVAAYVLPLHEPRFAIDVLESAAEVLALV